MTPSIKHAFEKLVKQIATLPATSETPEETPEEKTAREHSETQVTLKAVNYSG